MYSHSSSFRLASLPPVSAPSPSASINAIPPAGRTRTPSLSIIVDGGEGFNRKTVERLIKVPGFALSIIDCSELVGANPVERGLALLREIRRLTEAGEFSPFIPTAAFLHGTVQNGELILQGENGSFSIPAIVLLHALSVTQALPATASFESPCAPFVLSCCKAGHFAQFLPDSPRPVLISGGEHNVYGPDALAVMIRCIKEAQYAWMDGKALDTERLFDAISHTSGEPLHRIEQGQWQTHEVLHSVTSLDEIDPRQEVLYLCAMLAYGSVDQLAEALLLFGTDPLHRHFPYDSQSPARSNPVLWHLATNKTRDFLPKLVLLLALGEDVNQKNGKGNTLLHDACKWPHDDDDRVTGNETLARVLLANGANPYAQNRLCLMPSDLAQYSENDELIALFDPEAGSGNHPEFGPAGLMQKARRSGWGSVASLLEELGIEEIRADATDEQAMEVSDS